MYPTVSPEPGVTRQVLTDAPDLMLVRVAFETGATGKTHRHRHVQATFVQSGRFRFSLDRRAVEVGPGETVTMEADQPHGVVCLQAGVLIDSFSPRREEFL